MSVFIDHNIPERTTYRVFNPDLKGYWMFFGRVDVGESWFFHAPVPRDTTPENYDFQGLLNRAAGFEFTATFGKGTLSEAYRSSATT